MFYFLPFPILYFNPILVIAAVVPAIYLLVRVYQLDRLEKENKRMLLNMVKAGVFFRYCYNRTSSKEIRIKTIDEWRSVFGGIHRVNRSNKIF